MELFWFRNTDMEKLLGEGPSSALAEAPAEKADVGEVCSFWKDRFSGIGQST